MHAYQEYETRCKVIEGILYMAFNALLAQCHSKCVSSLCDAWHVKRLQENFCACRNTCQWSGRVTQVASESRY